MTETGKRLLLKGYTKKEVDKFAKIRKDLHKHHDIPGVEEAKAMFANKEFPKYFFDEKHDMLYLSREDGTYIHVA